MQPETLPRFTIGRSVVTLEESTAILRALPQLDGNLAPGMRELKSPLTRPAWVISLKAESEPVSLDLFIRTLYQRYHAAGRPASGRWVNVAVAALGGDGCALEISTRVRLFAVELNRQGANLGIDILREIGTDTAISQLDHLAQKVKRNSVKEHAREAVEIIAKARNLSLDELADRVVPSAGLTENGSATFDFGPRQFYFVAGPGLRPLVRDAAGKVLKTSRRLARTTIPPRPPKPSPPGSSSRNRSGRP